MGEAEASPFIVLQRDTLELHRMYDMHIRVGQRLFVIGIFNNEDRKIQFLK